MKFMKSCLLVVCYAVAASVAIAQSGDFNQDGIYDCADINFMQAEILAGSTDPIFDLSGNGEIDSEDTWQWLVLAGAVNLPNGNPYLPGDGNLDGFVDISDFNVWNDHKFEGNSNYCDGDFNGDGSVDVGDFMIWNGSKFTSSDFGLTPPPAPGSLDEMVTFAYDPESGLLSMNTGEIGINCFSVTGPNPLDTMDLNSGFLDENGSRWLFSAFNEHLKWMSNETTDVSGYFELAVLETGLTAEDFGEIGFMNQAFETGTTTIQIVGAPNVVPEPGSGVPLLAGAALILLAVRRRQSVSC